MKANIGSADKIFRIVTGLLIILAGVFFQSWWGALGAIPLITAFINWCPLYAPFGISTCKVNPKT